jgi:hypothetical protein
MRKMDFEGSSNVKSAELKEDGSCVVTFANGSGYAYKGMTEALMEDWKAAPSAGKWFHHKIRSKPAEFPPIGEIPAETPPTGAVSVEAKDDKPEKVTDDERVRWGAKLKEQTETIARLQLEAKELKQENAKLREDLAKPRDGQPAAQARDFRPWRSRPSGRF